MGIKKNKFFINRIKNLGFFEKYCRIIEEILYKIIDKLH